MNQRHRGIAAELDTLLRFAIGGGINSLTHAALFFILAKMFNTSNGAGVMILAWVLSIPPGYFVQSKFVWKKRMTMPGLLRLAVSYIPGIVGSAAVSGILGLLRVSLFFQEVAGLFTAAVLSYFLQRFWVYRR